MKFASLLSLQRLWPYLLRYRRPMIAGMICVMASNVGASLAPWILKVAIDALRSGAPSYDLSTYAVAILGASTFHAVFLFLMRKIMIGVSREIEYDLRNDLYGHMQLLSQSYYNRMYTGDLMSRCNNDLAAVRLVLGPAIMYSVNTLFTSAFAMTMMGIIDIPMMLMALLPLPVVSWLVTRYGRVIHNRFKDVQEQFSRISTTVQENLSGIKVVKAFGREEQEIREFSAENREYLERNKKLIRVWGILYPAVEMMAGLGILIVIWYGGRAVILGRLSLGEFVAFHSYLAMLIWPAIALGWVVNITQRGAASMSRLNQIFDEVPEIRNPQTLRIDETRKIEGKIEFRNVQFGYSKKVPVLRDVSFTVNPGETVAIVGATGDGKTTLLHLIPRMYDPDSGEILIDGIPLKEYPLSVIRTQIGLVPQDTFLFSDTIAENIGFGMREAAMEDVETAAALAQFNGEIREFPKQYKTMIGERGITLSGGQKQRATLARAIGADPSILILDDSFSSVDTHTEERILEGLRRFRKGRTCILVSHRFSTIQDADRIFVLAEGTVQEEGNHLSLLDQKGIYWDLYQKQLIEEELHITMPRAGAAQQLEPY